MEASLITPAGWTVEPQIARLEVPAKGKASTKVAISIPAGWSGRYERVAIAADVMADGKYVGQVAEAVVDLRPGPVW